MSSIKECVHETDIANDFYPKIVKSERLQDISDVSNNLDYKLISKTIKHSLWDKQTNELGHSLTRIQLINNLDLKEQYENHKKERKQKSKKEKICERTVYYVCFDEQQAIDISNNGFKCTESDNFLGDSSQGIHFSKHLDILLKYEYSKDNRANQLFCIMTKAFYDVEKLKTIKAKYDNKDICASKLHDGHVACLNLLCLTNANSNLASKLILKNYHMETFIYLYGLDESFQCIKKPKNILPYAILKYELKNPHVFNRKLIKPRQNTINTIRDRYFNNLIEKNELFLESDACRLVKNFQQEETASVPNLSDNDDYEPKDDLKLLDDYYLNEQEENNEKMPKWRIIYEKTGNLDTMFHGSRRMECRLNNVKHLGLKYVDDDKSIINVNNPTNKFILQYYSKRIKKNITSTTTTTSSNETDLNLKYVKKDDSNTNVKSILRIGLQSYLNVNFSYIPVNRTNKIKSSSLATEVNEIKNVKFEKPITKSVSAPVQTKSLVKPTVKQISTIIKSSKESSDPTKKQLVKSAEELKKKQPQQQNSGATKQPLSKTEELIKKQPKEEVSDKNKPLIQKKIPTTTSVSSENISKSKTTTSNSNNTTTKSVANLITSRPQAKEVIKNVFEKNRSKLAIASTTNPSSSAVVSSKSLSSSVEIKKLDLTEKLIESIKNSSKRKKSFWDPDSDTEYGKLSNNPYSLSIDDEDDLDDDIVIVSKQNLNLPPVQYSKQFYDSNINGFETELKKFSPAYISSSSSSPLNNNNIINNNTITTITKSPIKHKNSVYNRANTEPMPISKRTFNHRLVNRQRYIHHITVNNITNTATNNNNNDLLINKIDVDSLKNLKYSTENKNNNNSGTIEIHAAGFRCIEEHNFQQSVNYLRRTKSLEAKNNSNELFTKTQSFSLNTNESSNNNKKISLNDYVSNRCSKSSTTTPITLTNLNNSNSESLLSNNIKKEVQTITTAATTPATTITNEQQQLPSLSLIDEVKKRINANRNELKEELYSNQSLIKQDDLYDDDELKKIQHRHMKLKRQKKKQEKSKQKKIKLLADMSDDDDDNNNNNNNNNSLYIASSSSSFKSSDSILSDLLLSDNDDLSLTDDNDDDSSLSSLSSLTSSTTSSSTINRHKQKKKHNKKRKISDSETNVLDTTLTITDSKKVKHSTKKKKISDNNNNSSSGSNPHNNSSNAKLMPTKDDDYSIEIGDINLDEFNAKIDEKLIDEKIVINNNEQEILKPPSIENNYDNFYSAYDIEDSNILSDKTAKSERLSPIKSSESETIINNKKSSIIQQKETPKSNQNTPINNLTPNNQSNKIMTPKTAPPSLNQPNNNNNRRFQNNFTNNNNNNYYNNPSYVSPINPRNSQMNKSNISRNSITPPLPITHMPNNNNKSSLNYPNKMQSLNRSGYPNNNNNMTGSYPFNNVHSLDPSPSIVPNMNYVPNFYQTVMNQMSYNGNQQMSSHHAHYNNNPPVTDYPDYDYPNNNYQYYNNYNNNNYQRQGNIKEKGYNNNYNNFQNYQQRNFNNNNDYRSNNNNNNRHQYQLNNSQQRSANLSSNNNNSNNHNKRAQNPDQEDGEIVD